MHGQTLTAAGNVRSVAAATIQARQTVSSAESQTRDETRLLVVRTARRRFLTDQGRPHADAAVGRIETRHECLICEHEGVIVIVG